MGDFCVTREEREAMRHEAEESPHASTGYRTDVPRLLDALAAAEAETERMREAACAAEARVHDLVLRASAVPGMSATLDGARWACNLLMDAADVAVSEHEGRYGECNCGMCLPLKEALAKARAGAGPEFPEASTRAMEAEHKAALLREALTKAENEVHRLSVETQALRVERDEAIARAVAEEREAIADDLHGIGLTEAALPGEAEVARRLEKRIRRRGTR